MTPNRINLTKQLAVDIEYESHLKMLPNSYFKTIITLDRTKPEDKKFIVPIVEK